MAKKNGTRTRAEAKKLMWEYYRDNKASLPKWIVEFREEIIEGLVSGSETDIVFNEYRSEGGAAVSCENLAREQKQICPPNYTNSVKFYRR